MSRFVSSAVLLACQILHTLAPTLKAGDALLTPSTTYNAVKVRARVCALTVRVAWLDRSAQPVRLHAELIRKKHPCSRVCFCSWR